MKVRDLHENHSCHCSCSIECMGVESLKIREGEIKEKIFSDSKIIFVLEGSLLIEFTDMLTTSVDKSYFIFVPTGILFRCNAKKDSLIMIVSVHGNPHLCRGVNISDLYSEKSKVKGQYIPYKEVIPLEMNEMVWGLATGLNRAILLKIMCKQYFEVKIQEFFILLRVFYSKDQLRKFFYHVLSPNMIFSEFVNRNWLKYNTVNSLSGAMNLSVNHFSKKFKQIFGIPPGEWIMQRKTQYILQDIQLSDKTFQQIAADYDFAAVTNFNRFCKKAFSKTPGQIRGICKKNKKDIESEK